MIVKTEHLQEFIRQVRKANHYFGGWLKSVTVQADVYEAMEEKLRAMNKNLGAGRETYDGGITLCGIEVLKGGK